MCSVNSCHKKALIEVKCGDKVICLCEKHAKYLDIILSIRARGVKNGNYKGETMNNLDYSVKFPPFTTTRQTEVKTNSAGGVKNGGIG